MKINIAIFAVLLFSCSDHFKPVGSMPSKDLDSIQIDNTYKLYTRSVSRRRSETNPTSKLATNENTLPEDLIEIDYLLFSEKRGEILYITTRPDPAQLYYSRHSPRKDTLDMLRFSRFQFGKIDPIVDGQVAFVNVKAKEKNIWVIDMFNDSLHIDRIIQMTTQKGKQVFEYNTEVSADYALASKLIFAPHDLFGIVYDRGGKGKDLPILLGNWIYYTKDKKERIYMKLDREISNNDSRRILRFGNERIHFPPAK